MINSFLIGLALVLPSATGDVKHQVTGVFAPDRVDDLKQLCANLPEIQLVSVDFVTAEAVFRYDPKKVTLEKLDNMIKQASHDTFGIKPVCTVPHEQLTRVEIPVAGLDCKACSLALYEIVTKLDGVEHATASFKEGKVVVWVHPGKIDRPAIEKALKAREVMLKDTQKK